MKLVDINNKEIVMKPRHIMAPQDSIKEALWNSTNDRWSRNAKHPLPINEREIEVEMQWEKGDIAVYESKDVEINIPNGPDGTVGIILEGKLKMVSKSKLSESVLGGTMGTVQAIAPINRIMQLAGLSIVEEKNEDNTNDVAHYMGDELPQPEDQSKHKEEEKVDETVQLKNISKELNEIYEELATDGGTLQTLDRIKKICENVSSLLPKEDTKA